MTNQAIKIERIYVSDWRREVLKFTRAEKLLPEFQKEINKKCPEGYKYKETISFEKDKDYNWIEAIVAYEEIPK